MKQRPPESTPDQNWRSRLRPQDLLTTGVLGLRTRPGRTALTALGIAIGIASMVAVLGISASSKADLLAKIDALGTNLLQVRPNESSFGEAAKLPTSAKGMLDRMSTVHDSATVAKLDTKVKRHRHDDAPNGLEVIAADQDLSSITDMQVQRGCFLDHQTTKLPVAVLGSVAAKRLGITSLRGGPTVTIAERQFQVVGILDSLPLHPGLDRAAIIGDQAAQDLLGVKPNPTAIYLSVVPNLTEQLRPIIARTTNPQTPSDVTVSQPSEALQARAEVDQSLQTLLLALGAVALLVGGVGIANVMVISVLERRGEIGVRRAMGATKAHIRAQFIIEAATLSTLGGLLGALLGATATWAYATSQQWAVDIPLAGLAAAVISALTIGAFAGLYPATKAARLDPADAVRPHS